MSSVHYPNPDEPSPTPSNREDVCLVGECLRVPVGYKFPRICLFSGLSVNGAPKAHRLQATTTSGDPFLSVSTTREVVVHYYVHPSVSQIHLRTKIIALSVFVLGIGSGIWAATHQSQPVFFVILGLPAAVFAYFFHKKQGNSIHATRISTNYVTIAGIPLHVREAIYAAGNG